MSILSDEFYYQPIRIDTINTRVFADLIAKEGDANGRGLLLTLTENGLMKDTTGITLILKWEHTSVGNQGLDNFEAVDPSKGLYKITYPAEMLNRGKVRAFIRIIDSGKLTGTRNIEITVDRGVGDDTAIASSDSFTALAQALIDVTNLESTYAPRLLSVEQQLTETVNDIDTSLTPRILSVEQQLTDVKSTDTSHASRILSVEQQLTLISGAPFTFAPTLLSGWVNYGEGFAAAGYYKGPDNRVHLQGLIKSGTVADGTVIFTLPEGFRPLQKEILIVFVSGGGFGRVDVNDNGSVVAKIVNATYTSLSGISFLAKN